MTSELELACLVKVLDAYRTKLRDDLPGAEGDEIARKRVESFANKMRPAAFLVSNYTRVACI